MIEARQPEFDKESSPRTGLRRIFAYMMILTVISVLAAWLLPNGHDLPVHRAASARNLITQMSQATKAYEMDHGVFPAGTGMGSKCLVTSLREKGAKQMQYFEFDEAMLDQGQVVNPVWRKEGGSPRGWIHYRSPGLHNPKTFDLWCADSKGKIDGINNWE